MNPYREQDISITKPTFWVKHTKSLAYTFVLALGIGAGSAYTYWKLTHPKPCADKVERVGDLLSTSCPSKLEFTNVGYQLYAICRCQETKKEK